MLRLLPAIPITIALLVACADGGGAGTDTDGYDGSDGSFDDSGFVYVQDTDSMGTQVGSEGFWGCPIEDYEELQAELELSTLEGTPADLTRERAGDWVLSVIDDGSTGSTSGGLNITDNAAYLWIDVTDGPGCEDHLAASVTASLSRGTAEGATLTGYLAIRPSGGRLIVSAEGDMKGLAVDWGPPDFGPATEFQLDATIDPASVVGKASWLECDKDVCTNTDVLADVTSTR